MNREELIREFDAEIDELMRGRSGEDAKQTAIVARKMAEKIADLVILLLGEDIPRPHYTIFPVFDVSGMASIEWEFRCVSSDTNKKEIEKAKFPDASGGMWVVVFALDISPCDDEESIYFRVFCTTEPVYGPTEYGLGTSWSMHVTIPHDDSPESRSEKMRIIKMFAREILEYNKLPNWTVPPRA